MNVTSATTTLVTPSSLADVDFPLRRRIKAELLEIKAELVRNYIEAPIIGLLNEWLKNFRESLNHPDPALVIGRFLSRLESIFEDPLKPGRFSPRLFGEEPIPAVRYLIAKMRNRDSLLYSSRLDGAVPNYLTSRISNIQAASLQTPEPVDFQKLKERLIKKRQEQQEKFKAIEAKVQELGKIQQDIQATRDEIHHFDKTVERLEKESMEHQVAVNRLDGDLGEVKGAAEDVRRQNIELEIRCNKVDAAIKDQQGEWLKSLGYVALSIVVSLAINEMLPGSSAIFSKGQGTFNTGFKF
jgi:hypothetical protein